MRIDVKRSDGSLAATINDRGLLHFESFIPKERGEQMFRAGPFSPPKHIKINPNFKTQNP